MFISLLYKFLKALILETLIKHIVIEIVSAVVVVRMVVSHKVKSYSQVSVEVNLLWSYSEHIKLTAVY